jgi:hypothetical protein
MKNIITAVLISTVGMASTAWAQATSAPVEAGTADPIVHMREQIQAAHRTYEKKKSAAKRVYEQRVKVAKQERDTAIKTARDATPNAPQEGTQSAN